MQLQLPGAYAELVSDPVLQHPRLQVARVDPAAKRRDAGEERALAIDRLGERLAVGGERMASPRFGETAQQRARIRLQVEHAGIDAALLQFRDVLRQRGQS